MAESIGMILINQRSEDIIRAFATHEFTVVDLRRVQKRFKDMATITGEIIDGINKELGGKSGS